MCTHSVVFLVTLQKGGELKFFAPPLTDQDFNRVVGNYSQSIFCSCSTRALTATSVGNVVVWDNNPGISGGKFIYNLSISILICLNISPLLTEGILSKSCHTLMHASEGILNLPTSSLHLCSPFQQNR